MLKGERILVFGDQHLNWQATQLVLGDAARQNIDTVITLGDEEHKIFPLSIGDPKDHDLLYAELRGYKTAKRGRQLICMVGDKTAGIPDDMLENFVGVGSDRRIKSLVFQDENIIAGHNGEWILEKHKGLIDRPPADRPLVIFHGHSHSIGVLPEYKWLDDDEFIYWFDGKPKEHLLEKGKVYWVNPGANYFQDESGNDRANYAIYDRKRQVVTLFSTPFDKNLIRPSA